MFTDSIDMFGALVIGSGFLMIIVIWFDRRLTRRRSLVMNRRYGQRLHEGRRNSRLHLIGYEEREKQNQGLVIGPEILVRRPGFFSKRRDVTDASGQIVATHYEQLIINQPHRQQRCLTLTARRTPLNIAA